jgi:hypothetical protein
MRARRRRVRCVPLQFAACGGDPLQLRAELPWPIELGAEACLTMVVEDPAGGILPLGGFELSTGSDACTTGHLVGGYTTPIGSLVTSAQGSLCIGPTELEPERITGIGMRTYLGFGDNPSLVKLELCDVCPAELVPR